MSTNPRDSSLDLTKWLAMLSMVIDHLRYIFPSAEWLFIPGRFAFPFFALAMAINVARAPVASMITDTNTRYLVWLIGFTVLSEVPYRWLDWSSSTVNIMPTLMLGLLVAWGVHYRFRPALLLSAGVVVLAGILHPRLMYGVFGVLMPAAFLLGFKRCFLWVLLPAALCAAANARNGWVLADSSNAFAWAIWGRLFCSAHCGLSAGRQSSRIQVWPVRRWGYLFYPGHLVAIKLLKILT